MCDKEVLKLCEVLQSLTRMLKILLQRAEQTFPALKENMVSALCMKGIVSACSLMFFKFSKKTFDTFRIKSCRLRLVASGFLKHKDS
jgi:hypothetical protein